MPRHRAPDEFDERRGGSAHGSVALHMSPYLSKLFEFRWLLHPFPRPARERFVIFGQSRTGSTLLRSLLNAHPEVTCEGELYLNRTPFPYRYHLVVSRRSRTPVWGFKLFSHHLERHYGLHPRTFMEHMHEHGYTIIHLRRENIVRHTLSQFLRHASGVTHQRSSQPLRTIHLDMTEFLDHLSEREYYGKLAEAAVRHVPHVTVSYERDLEPPAARQRLMDTLFDRFGVATVPAQSELKQINTKALPDLVENYDELHAALADTPHAQWLEAPDPSEPPSSAS